MKIFLILLLILIHPQALADEENIEYVTGKLRLSLYKKADSGSGTRKLLSSGDRLQIKQVSGAYARVITDSGLEGWVKKGFLVKEKPALILYNELQIEHKSLQEQLQNYENENRDIDQLKSKLNELELENNQLSSQFEDVRVKNEQLEEQLIQKQEDSKKSKQEKPEKIVSFDSLDSHQLLNIIQEYIFLLIGIVILLFLIGWRLGEIKTERQINKHFGGVKVW